MDVNGRSSDGLNNTSEGSNPPATIPSRSSHPPTTIESPNTNEATNGFHLQHIHLENMKHSPLNNNRGDQSEATTKSHTQSDSDDNSNESGSLPSESSSTIDSSASLKKEGSNFSVASPKSTNKLKSSKRKKDRSKLRKGKWTLEEEEYTSRIIHYFSTGLLTLPEGATLRSYLADKLNCDPMRITKKYAGASCLGRRVYHFRDRVHPTIAEIQVAKVELDHLEQRFRLRIEGGNPSNANAAIEQPQLIPSNSAVSVLPPTNYQNPQNLLQTMLLGLSALQQQQNVPMTQQQTAPVATTVNPNPVLSTPFLQPTSLMTAPGAAAIPPVLAQLLLANAANNSNAFPSLPADPYSGVPQLPGVDPMVTNWALSQVAAALAPALTQLAASGSMPSVQNPPPSQQLQLQQFQAQQQQQIQAQQQQQVQQQQQQEQQLLVQQKAQLQSRIQEQQAIVNQKLFLLLSKEKEEAKTLPQSSSPPPPPPPSAPVPPPVHVQPNRSQPNPKPSSVHGDHSNFFAAQFKEAYDRHLLSLGIKPEPKQEKVSVKENASATLNDYESPNTESPSSTDKDAEHAEEQARTEEDKEGGTALLGFLSSLRKSYENVLRDKQLSIGGESTYSNRPATVTDSNSSQQRDSSVEDSDWNSDKKTDTSSSEDSEKEERREKKGKNLNNVYQNQGPPRKRMKVKRVADEIRKGPTSSS